MGFSSRRRRGLQQLQHLHRPIPHHLLLLHCSHPSHCFRCPRDCLRQGQCRRCTHARVWLHPLPQMAAMAPPPQDDQRSHLGLPLFHETLHLHRPHHPQHRSAIPPCSRRTHHHHHFPAVLPPHLRPLGSLILLIPNSRTGSPVHKPPTRRHHHGRTLDSCDTHRLFPLLLPR